MTAAVAATLLPETDRIWTRQLDVSPENALWARIARVALKVLHPRVARDRDAAERFFQEARAATHIAHPNIVDVLDMGEDPADGALFIVQELLDDESLNALLTLLMRPQGGGRYLIDYREAGASAPAP